MKIEMGESLFYSWLRHVKGCQIVQTNWKASPSWEIKHAEKIEATIQGLSQYYKDNHNYNLFKKSRSVSQIMRQSEADVIGIRMTGEKPEITTVDVAFHEGGLLYGNRQETVAKVLSKLVRTAMCIYGYFDCQEAEIVFASPKIYKAVLADLLPAIVRLNRMLEEYGFGIHARIIANDDFNDIVLKPILDASSDVADTSELFMRSYQMYKMFSE